MSPDIKKLSPRFRDFGQGLYLQMYYWGRDVIHPSGNLLMQYGFKKIAKEGLHGTSRYQLEWEGGIIELHGYCAGWYRPDGAGFIYIRQRRTLQICHETSPVKPGSYELAEIHSPRGIAEWHSLAETVSSFTRWLLDYEKWITKRQGSAYREGIFYEYRRLPISTWWLPPHDARRWMETFSANPSEVPRARKFTATLQPL